MSLIVVGLSHRTAPLDMLERAALAEPQRVQLGHGVVAAESVAEAVLLATCNRLEIYAEAATFHGGVTDLGQALAEVTGICLPALQQHLFVHYEERAVAHLFEVACGLDSMAVGEAEILGQLKDALTVAQRHGWVGASLNSLLQHGIRVGKRAHSETAIDDVSVSLVEAGLARAAAQLGPVDELAVCVVGAGSMSGLAAASLARLQPRTLTIVNRSADRAHRLAANCQGRARPWHDLGAALGDADLIVTCTGAMGHVVSAEIAGAARRGRAGDQVYVDLAMPRDVDADVGSLPGVWVHDLSDLAVDTGAASGGEIADVTRLVAAEVADYVARRAQRAIAPTVTALRARAAAVVDSEMHRLDARHPELTDQLRGEIRQVVSRVVDKLLHAPTVKVKQLGHEPAGDYAKALRELFDLDPFAVAAVSAPDLPPPTGGEPPADRS